jgi:hypothetical protein
MSEPFQKNAESTVGTKEFQNAVGNSNANSREA